MTGQLDLFSWAAQRALHEACRRTERACSLRGAARRAIERAAATFYDSARYWAQWRLS